MHRSAAILIVLITLGLASRELRAQQAPASAEEILVQFTVPDVGSTMIPGLVDENTIFLPVADVFAFLRIRMDTLGSGAAVTGFIVDEHRTYRIDPAQHTIEFAGNQQMLGPEKMFSSEGRIYLRNDQFGPIFGLFCAFNFRDLEVRLHTDFELPAVRDMKRERARRALHHGAETPFYDRTVRSTRTVATPGVAEWAVNGGMDPVAGRTGSYSMGLGGEVLGGSLEARIRGAADSLPSLNNMSFRWHYVDNDFAPVRQITAGQIGSPLPDPFRGNAVAASITNRSTIRSNVYGVYVIQDRTEPLWGVELYADGRLVDFTTADSIGLFRFELPINYGATEVQLRFYGPWGEVRMMDRAIHIPYSFVPSGTVEYSATGGVVNRDGTTQHDPFLHLSAQYGVGPMLTIGGGAYVVNAGAAGVIFPFMQSSLRLADWFLLSGTYSKGLGGDVSVSIVPGTTASVSMGYSQRYASLDETLRSETRKATLNLATPVDLPGLHGGLAVDIADNISDGWNGVVAEESFATRLFDVPLAIGSKQEWIGQHSLQLLSVYGNAHFTCNPFGLALIRPSVEMDMRRRQVTSYSVELSRSIVQGVQFDVSINRDLVVRQTTSHVGVQFTLPFALASIGAQIQDGHVNLQGGSSGSVYYDNSNSMVLTSSRTGMDRASVVIRPFLDVNGNGRYDSDEPLVAGIDVTATSGTIRHSSDTLIRVLDLDPNVPVILSVDDAHLPNVSWRTKQRTLQVLPAADRFESIDVPVVVAGEVNGHVMLEHNGKLEGIAGIIVRFRREDGSQADSVTTQDGGEFYSTMASGHYTVTTDADQLKTLQLESLGPREIDLRGGTEGDVINGVDLKVMRDQEGRSK